MSMCVLYLALSITICTVVFFIILLKSWIDEEKN